MKSWWEFAEHSGYPGSTLAAPMIECAFCGQRGKFSFVKQANSVEPNGDKKLHFDTLRCLNCGNHTMVFWSASTDGQSHDFRQLPWPIGGKPKPSGAWPSQVGEYWSQARDNANRGNWEAAIVMARSALQIALRHHKAKGKSLQAEINDLARGGVLPPTMKEWSDDVVRYLGNATTHPQPGQPRPTSEQAKDVLAFLNFLLEYLYDLPARIKKHRVPATKGKGKDSGPTATPMAETGGTSR